MANGMPAASPIVTPLSEAVVLAAMAAAKGGA